MSRASTVAFGALAAALLAAVIGLVIEVRRGPEPVGTRGSARPASSSVAAADPAPVPPPARPAAGLPGTGSVVPAGSESSPGDPAASPDQLQLVQVARMERGKVLSGLRRSGTGEEPWDGTASALLDAVGGRAAHAESIGCFVAGCGTTLTFASAAEFERQRAEIEAMPDYQAWTGGKRWTVPEPQADGTVVVALALYRPD